MGKKVVMSTLIKRRRSLCGFQDRSRNSRKAWDERRRSVPASHEKIDENRYLEQNRSQFDLLIEQARKAKMKNVSTESESREKTLWRQKFPRFSNQRTRGLSRRTRSFLLFVFFSDDERR
jgi:uncharacterized protein (DUF885 family)